VTPPRGLVGAALVFWGWQTGFLPVALAMAALVEARPLLGVRWELSRADFNRISDGCAVILAAIALYHVLAHDSARAVVGILQALPLPVVPLLLSQLYSTAGLLDASIFFWSLRRRAAERPDVPPIPVDLTYPFVALTLLSASAANERTGVFFVGFALLAAWALWGIRPRRHSPALWVAVMGLAVGLGWVGHVAIAEGHRALERAVSTWLLDLVRRDTDPFRSSTALGQVGELKLSPRIVLRVETPANVRPPALLREAAYNVYNAPTWYAADAPFRSVLPGADGVSWRLAARAPEAGPVTISTYLRRGKGLLAAPNGAVQLDDLYVVELAANRMGALRVEEGLGLVRYGVRYARGASTDPPTRMDVAVPRHEAAAIARVADELALAGKTPDDAVDAVRTYFRRFAYSRFGGERPPGVSALDDFFFRTRRGHCEYFATATVLLLRAAGVPARYAVGYAVHEWSTLERRYVVRANDAHAWAMVWLDGAWREVDTTPPEWVAVERGAVSSLSVADVWSWAGYLFSRWRWSEREDRVTGSIGWLLVPLTALLAWRLYARRRVATRPTRPAAAAERRGADSAFYEVERRLARLAFPRGVGEPLSGWLSRVDAARIPRLDTARLPALLALHYRYRFDPAGLAPDDRRALDALAGAWLAEHPASRVR
jgi:transglutaminase-like putative cysteine protease